MGAEPVPVTPPPVVEGDGVLTFLVADDDRINRLVLVSLLERQGHRTIQAGDGAQAVELFERQSPDIVLMDVMMPVMDGLEATRRIKALCGTRLVPVIFLTALNDEQALQRCLEAGGDDFLTKPFSHTLLQAKINALLRTRTLYVELDGQHQRLQAEQQAAERIFRTIVHRGCLEHPALRYLISPMALFNGDLLLAARRPSGGLRVMLGDFAGHGLPAAVGAIPVSEIFYVMTAKGYSIGELVAEVNLKLKSVLPTGQFLAAALVELDRDGRSLTAWNGGVPDVLVRGADGALAHLPPRHPPLGVLGNDALDSGVELMNLAPGSRIVLYTDGAIDARNPDGVRFGQSSLEKAVSGGADPFRALCESLAGHRTSRSAEDDITLVEIAAERMAVPVVDAPFSVADRRAASVWSVSLELGAEALRAVDPLPACLQLAMELQGLHAHRERLYLILAELFSNALEHGLLRLDSALKRTPEGFSRYYAQRERALTALGAGTIRVTLTHRPEGGGGRLSVAIEDSGPGFSGTIPDMPGDHALPGGRGLALVRSLCRELIVHGRGNHLEAVYSWTP